VREKSMGTSAGIGGERAVAFDVHILRFASHDKQKSSLAFHLSCWRSVEVSQSASHCMRRMFVEAESFAYFSRECFVEAQPETALVFYQK